MITTPTVSGEPGQAPARLNQINPFILGSSFPLTVEAGYDIEGVFGNYADANTMLTSFANTADFQTIYNYIGDNECPTSSTAYTAGTPCGPSGKGYTVGGIYRLIYGLQSAYPFVEVYNTSNVGQWQKFQNYAMATYGYNSTIVGTLTQNDGCERDSPNDPTCAGRLAPDTAWTQMSNAITTDQYIYGETDIGSIPPAVEAGVA